MDGRETVFVAIEATNQEMRPEAANRFGEGMIGGNFRSVLCVEAQTINRLIPSRLTKKRWIHV